MSGCWAPQPVGVPGWGAADQCAGTDLWSPTDINTSVTMKAIAGYAVANHPYLPDEGWILTPADATAPVCA